LVPQKISQSDSDFMDEAYLLHQSSSPYYVGMC